METSNDMFAAGITPTDLKPIERRVMFTDDINKMLFENIEHIRQFIPRAKQTNPAPTINVSVQLDATMASLRPSTGKTEVLTK